MSFRWKTALCMVCLVSLLFGVGSCALISLSFQTSLAREEAAARASYDLLFRTLQMVESVEVWSGPQDAAQAIAQLSAHGEPILGRSLPGDRPKDLPHPGHHP